MVQRLAQLLCLHPSQNRAAYQQMILFFALKGRGYPVFSLLTRSMESKTAEAHGAACADSTVLAAALLIVSFNPSLPNQIIVFCDSCSCPGSRSLLCEMVPKFEDLAVFLKHLGNFYFCSCAQLLPLIINFDLCQCFIVFQCINQCQNSNSSDEV